ncbi:proton-conducting transporter transmembrane domain-containing protein [Kocuria marina]|uniref:proton-conducting transporter transmembrane domain-containing protein n=1 Tax=Kocuria marina TaxID=223184 RepID=UPI00272E4E4E
MILVWLRLGSSDSGGAFQSGAVLAGALILLRSAGVPLDRLTGRWLRPLLIVGMIGFILTGALIVSLGNARLGWSPEWSFAAMLTVEIALTAGIVRVVDDVYGIHVASELGVLTPLLIVACLTILYGPYQALRQEDLKKRLAYSTVWHVSYVVVGISLVTLAGTTRGVVHLVHQGLMKIALFFCAGLFAEALGITKLSQMHGLGRHMPWTFAAFTVGAFGMIGLPLTAGFMSKWMLGLGALESEHPWVVGVLIASSLLNAMYFLPAVYRMWFRDPADQDASPATARDGSVAGSETSTAGPGDSSATPSEDGTPVASDSSTATSGGSTAAQPGATVVMREPASLLVPTAITAAASVFVGLAASLEFAPLQIARQVAEGVLGRCSSPSRSWSRSRCSPSWCSRECSRHSARPPCAAAPPYVPHWPRCRPGCWRCSVTASPWTSRGCCSAPASRWTPWPGPCC